MKLRKIKKFSSIRKFYYSFLTIFLIGCSAPGMDAPSNSFFGGSKFLNGTENIIPIIDLNESNIFNFSEYRYIVSKGDQLTMIVWGQDEVFPVSGGFINSPIFSRLVDESGSIFVPYVGNVNIEGLTISETRIKVAESLSSKFINPQVDINIQTPSNKNRIFVQGEIRRPIEIPLGVSALTLSSALGKANGINMNTANARKVYIIRSYNDSPTIYRLNLQNADAFLISNRFVLHPEDIIYVGTSSITKWNRYLSQIFPFASFINQIDQVQSRE
jgi:protein involved in polysaccharide export with SLBB domain